MFCLEYVDDLRDGIFTEDDNLKCYISCMLDMLNITKKGKINYSAAMRHIEMLVPRDLKVCHLKIDWKTSEFQGIFQFSFRTTIETEWRNVKMSVRASPIDAMPLSK